MKKKYIISIHDKVANVLHVEKKRSLLHIIDNEVLEIDQLTDYLKEKHSFYVVVAIDELIDDVVTVPSVIKNKRLLQSYILKRFKDSLPTKNILLNFQKISEDKEESTITYKVDAVAEKEYLQTLQLIPDWKEIESATIDNFALLSITRKCYENSDKKGYFSIYTHGGTMTVLAIDEANDLLFERTTVGAAMVGESRFLGLVDEILQTIAYVKQKFRSNEFSTLIIGGSLSLDDEVAQHLLFSTNLNVAVMYPNTFIKGLENEEPQQHILALGSFFVKKSDMFLPDKVRSLREYEFVSKSLMFIATLSLLVTTYFTYEQFSRYNETLNRYDAIKNRLLRMIRSTNTYSLDELEKSYKHLQIAKRYLQYHPSDILLKLKPLAEMLPPSNYVFDGQQNDKEPRIGMRFEKSFSRLSDLYAFEKKFKAKFSTINSDDSMEYSEKTDYKKMMFIAEIISVPKQQTQPAQRRRRR